MQDRGGARRRAGRVLELLRSTPAIADRVAFPHIPKCGGTSLTRALRPHFSSRQVLTGTRAAVGIDAEASIVTADALRSSPFSDHRMRVHALRHAIAHYELQRPSTRFLYGHFTWGPALADVDPDVCWITILRDPVDRVLSQYAYNRFKTRGSTRHALDLDEFVATRAPRLLLEPARYLCGPDLWDAPPDEQVAAACATVDRFDVVGTLDDIERFHVKVSRRLGVDVSIPHVNRSPAPPSVEPELAAVRDELRRLAGPAMVLHEHARRAASAPG